MSMGNEVKITSPLIGSGVATQALDGTAELGDQHLVEPFPNSLQVAVVDGVGHGDRAVAGAKTAVTTLAGHAHYGRGMDDALVPVACTIGDLSRAQTRDALWTTSCTN